MDVATDDTARVGRVADSLRIGVLSDDCYPHSGGVSRSIEQQINHLVALGHQVRLFVPQWDLVPPATCEWEGLPQWRLPGTPSYLCSLAVTPRTIGQVADAGLDVIHSQNERGSLYLGALAARRAGVPHVHTFHSNYVGTHRTNPTAAGLNSLTYLPLSGGLLRLATGHRTAPPARLPDSPEAAADSLHARRDWRNLARLAARTDAFTSPAGYMVSCIVAAAPELTGRGHVVPSGVDAAFARARRRRDTDGVVRFVTCSRLGPEKRVDAVVRAFAQLGRDDAELVVIGDGPEERALRRLAAGVRHGRVRFLGRLDDTAEVAQQLADADVFVLASYHFDTQGMVLGEAAAAGAPILYCDERLHVGVGPENALLVGPQVADLAAGMAELADDPARREQMAAASRGLAGSLGGDAMAQAYVDVYRAAVAGSA